MKILTFTTLFPNQTQPRHGIFVAERLRHFRMAYPEIEHRVVAPVPWFPFRNSRFGHYALLASIPSRERRNGLDVMHPRYPVIPKVGMNVAPGLMAAKIVPWLRRFRESWAFDAIDAHFIYPDGVCAVIAGRLLGVPVVVTARGSDITLYPRWRIPRSWIRWTLENATVAAAVCRALADEMMELVPDRKVEVLRNGVDLDKFRPCDREQVRREAGVDQFTLLSVGNLIELKGHHLVIQALKYLPEVQLLIAGDGPWKERLMRQASDEGVFGRVRFLGRLTQEELVRYYNASDALVLASSREGMANVLLESIACGTPVVATDVWGTPEVVTGDAAGILIRKRTPQEIARCVNELRENYPGRCMTRRHAELYSWERTTEMQMEIFRRVVGTKPEGSIIR